MASANLKILYVITHVPCPPTMGAHHRVLNIGRQLQKCGKVTVVYAGKAVEPVFLDATKREFSDLIVMRPKTYKGPETLIRLRTNFNFHWPWHYANKVSKSDRQLFAKLCRQHDVVWFHTLPAADCFGIDRLPKSVMDIDDLNHVKYQMRTEYYDTGLRQKIAHKFLVFKWKKREIHVLDRFSLMTVCSNADKQYLGDDKRIYVIPNGFEPPQQQPRWTNRNNMRIGFIGNVEYGPNRDGLKWFADAIWPMIISRVPEARLRIVGRLPVKHDFLSQPGFETLGFVDDTAEEFATWSAMIVPLRIGGGTRLKILEAFSKMCPVISTPAGAYGMGVSDGKDIILREDVEAFGQSCINILKNPESGRDCAQGGWELFKTKYTWETIGIQIRSVVQECIKRKTQVFI